MKITAGLWIDHRKAIIVFLKGDEEEIKQIKSDFEKSHDSGGSSIRADDQVQNETTEHLNKYYDEVISALQNTEAVLILGPGEAKGELKKRLEKSNHNAPEIEVETADKMTENQLVAKVREHFLKKH